MAPTDVDSGRGGLRSAAAVAPRLTARVRASAAAALLAVAVALPALAAEAAPAQAARVNNLYHPGHLTRFGYLNFATTVRTRPDARAPALGRLRLRTQDGTDEVVLVLATTAGRGGREWLRIQTPLRPTGTTGWIPRSAVGELRTTSSWLRIDRRRLQATVVRSGRVVFRAPVGIGRPGAPTPAGRFYVRDRLVPARPGTIYGALAFGTSARSEVLTDWPGGAFIGIHGTNRPGLLPGRVSHGCVRMRNSDILRLDRFVTVGMPVTIY